MNNLNVTNIKRLRICQGLSVQELADKIHVTRQSIYNYESGKQFPNKGVIKKLCKFFNVDVSELIS